jgi:hypothetical protein
MSDFLERVARAYRRLGSLSGDAIALFGARFPRVRQTRRLRPYCRGRGDGVVACIEAMPG